MTIAEGIPRSDLSGMLVSQLYSFHAIRLWRYVLLYDTTPSH